MSFEVDRYSVAWAHIALCADLTWVSDQPDEFTIANQRLWARHCRLSQVFQGTEPLRLQANNQSEFIDKRSSVTSRNNKENGNHSKRRSVKDVIPESRLAQFYGNFYYDETREQRYRSCNETSTPGRGQNGQGCESTSQLTECWTLPEVEYWFRKLVEEPTERGLMMSRRRRQYRMLANEDFGRWDPCEVCSASEAALAVRVRSVRHLWSSESTSKPPTPERPRAFTPPTSPRKIRARRRQPKRLAALAPPPPAYCLDAPLQLLCDPVRKFQFERPKPPQLMQCQQALSRFSANVQAAMRASVVRTIPYRGTNVGRYTPTTQRYPDRRCGVWWPRDHPSPRLERLQLNHFQTVLSNSSKNNSRITKIVKEENKREQNSNKRKENENVSQGKVAEDHVELNKTKNSEQIYSSEENIENNQTQSTSTAAAVDEMRKKRLYSTVLSTSAPAPITLPPGTGCVRTDQKLVTPGILKLNPKILAAARLRPPVDDSKFEELEKEALEQYKASDESIDTKFKELEKQAVEQYSNSNSNISCTTGNSTGKLISPSVENKQNEDSSAKFAKDKSLDSVVIYSQNFSDVNCKATDADLKNFQSPLRGGKRAQSHRMSKGLRNVKNEIRAASDTDYEGPDKKLKGNNKYPTRWTVHSVTPKKRHLTFCVSDISSDDDSNDMNGSIRDSRTHVKHHVDEKIKMSAHGGGDLHPIMRKT